MLQKLPKKKGTDMDKNCAHVFVKLIPISCFMFLRTAIAN